MAIDHWSLYGGGSVWRPPDFNVCREISKNRGPAEPSGYTSVTHLKTPARGR